MQCDEKKTTIDNNDNSPTKAKKKTEEFGRNSINRWRRVVGAFRSWPAASAKFFGAPKKKNQNQIKSNQRRGRKEAKRTKKKMNLKAEACPPGAKGNFIIFLVKKNAEKKGTVGRCCELGAFFFYLSLSLSLFLSLLCLPGFCSLVFILSFEVREEEPFTVKE